MSDVRSQLKDFWTGLDETRRRVLAIAGGASLLAIVSVGWWASQPSWTSLTRVGDADTRTAITDKLSLAQIPWRFAEDGATIEVRSQDEQSARKEAAGGHGLIGLGGVDQLDPWITPFQEQLQKQKMLQEELVLQINGIEGIAASRVLLNLKSGSGFIGDDARASAAVVVKADDGITLTPQTARAIAQLVSHSVAGMTDAEVSVVDQGTGRPLWSGGDNVEENAPADEAARREKRMAQDVVDALGKVLGSSEHVQASVHLDLDQSSSQSTVSAVDPDSQAPVREKLDTDQNSVTTGGGQGGSEAGVQSNLPQAAVAAVPAAPSASPSRKREQNDTQYLYTQTQTTTLKPAGDLKRVSAAVMVDSATLAAIAKASGQDETKLREDLQKAAEAALGFDGKRGDNVIVSFVPFAEAPMSDAALGSSFPWERLAPSAVALVAVLLTFFSIVRPLMKSFQLNVRLGKPATQPESLPGETLPMVAEDGSPLSEGAAARGAAAYARTEGQVGETGEDGKVIDLASRLRRQVEGFKHVSAEDVSTLVLRETDHSAEVLRRWIRS